MNQAAKPALTPPEILHAAYQAEASGQAAYAVQFYQHLVEYYSRTPEAAEAAAALQRLGHAPPVSRSPGAGKPLSEALAGHRPPAAAFSGPPAQHPQAGQVQPRRDVARRPPPEARPAPRLEPARGYKIGRALAALLIVAGWLALAIGLGMVGMNLAVAVGVVKVASVPAALRETLPVLAALIPGSFALLLLGQLCLAVFRTANATADIAAALRGDDDDD